MRKKSDFPENRKIFTKKSEIFQKRFFQKIKKIQILSVSKMYSLFFLENEIISRLNNVRASLQSYFNQPLGLVFTITLHPTAIKSLPVPRICSINCTALITSGWINTITNSLPVPFRHCHCYHSWCYMVITCRVSIYSSSGLVCP